MEPPDTIETEARRALEEVKRGNPQGMRHLVTALGPRMYAFLKRLLGQTEDAEDVLQETFTTLYAKAAQKSPDSGTVRGWAYAIARNHALQFIRRKAPPPALPPAPPTNDPAVRVAAGETLDRALAALPLDLRLPLLMRECLGLSYAEIADLTDRNTDLVAQDLFRARMRLRQLLEGVHE